MKRTDIVTKEEKPKKGEGDEFGLEREAWKHAVRRKLDNGGHDKDNGRSNYITQSTAIVQRCIS